MNSRLMSKFGILWGALLQSVMETCFGGEAVSVKR